MSNQLRERMTLTGQLLLRNPALLGDYCRWFVAERLPQPRPAAPHAPNVAPVGLGQILGWLHSEFGNWSDGPALELARTHWSRQTTTASDAAGAQALAMAADTSLGELAYALVRLTRPAVVIETGVATGVTSAFVLAGLSDNDSGALHSIDLPPTSLLAAGHVGIAVPTELRQRWVYHWGASRRLLPPLLRECKGSLPLFIHDSDHSYSGMRWEMEMAWTALAPGAWLLVDDAHLHSAAADVGSQFGVQPQYIRQSAKSGCAALFRTPNHASGNQEEERLVASGARRQLQPR